MASVSSFTSTTVLSEDFLHCPNCSRELQSPKMLPCLHSFCSECLESCLENADIKPEECFLCPICRSRCSVPKGGVAAMKSNVLVESMDAFLSFRNEVLCDESVPCGGCCRPGLIKAKAVKCVECNEWLCKACVKVHLKVKASKKHHMLTSEELLSGQQDDLIKENMAINYCQRHSLRHNCYCNDCDELVCEMCQNTIHHSHLLTPISIQASKDSTSIQAYIPLVNKSINNLNMRISNLKRQHKELVFFRKTFHKDFGEKVMLVIERLTRKLQTYALLLHDVVDGLTSDHIDKLKKHDLEDLNGNIEAAKSSLNFAYNLLEYDFPTCTIPVSTMLQKQLNTFQKPPKFKVPRLRSFKLNNHQKLSMDFISDMIGEVQLDGKKKNDNSLINFSIKLKSDSCPCVISDLAIDHDRSRLVVVDEANKNLKVFTFEGQLDSHSPDSFVKSPIRVVVLRNNHDFLINDENTLKRSDKSFASIKVFSRHKFRQPVGMSQSSNGEILVTEWLTGQVLGFDEVGTLVRTFPCHSRNPAYVSCSFSCDHIIVSDWKTHSIKIFHWNGSLISSYGQLGNPKDEKNDENQEEKDGLLDHPHGVCSDADDNILVCDSWNNRVKVLDWKGRYQCTLLDSNNDIKCPQAVDVTHNHCFVAERHGFVKIFEYTFTSQKGL